LGVLSRLSTLYDAAGRLDASLAVEDDILKRRQRTLPPSHPEVLKSRNNYAATCWRLGRYSESVPAFEELLRVRVGLSGTDDRDSIFVAFNLAANYSSAGKLADARRVTDEWLPRAREKLGLSSRDTIHGTLVAVGVEEDLGTPGRAEPLLRSLVASARENLGEGSLDLADVLQAAGANLLRLQRFTEAEGLLREALAIRETSDSDERRVDRCRFTVGMAALGRQNYAEADKLLEESYARIKRAEATTPVPARQGFEQSIERTAALYESNGQPDKAKVWRGRLSVRPELAPAPHKVDH
jgi:tetratricopeptide (TPR) repeat protein